MLGYFYVAFTIVAYAVLVCKVAHMLHMNRKVR
jgi:hypothetical protein